MKKILSAILILLALLSLTSCGQPVELPQDASPPTAEDILSGMSLEEKAAQLLLVSCHERGCAERASAYGVGGLCLYAFELDGKSVEEVAQMNEHFQQLSKLPLIISTDEEGGYVHRISSNPKLYFETFRSPGELRAANGFTSAVIDARAKSVLMEDLGFNVNLAPVCDVPLHKSDYIYDRCFSMDCEECAEYISAVIGAMQDYTVGSVLKHFPGYGGSRDTHLGISYDNRPLSAFEKGDLLPFEAGIAAGADAVMVSHNIVRCMDVHYPASLSPEVHRVLREGLDFDGVIMTDDLAMGAILRFAKGENAVVQALLAGNDMVCCSDFEESVAAIVDAVNEGILSEKQIDESVLRILNWKIDLGLI